MWIVKTELPLLQDTTDDEDGRESLATATLEEIVQRAQSAEPATQLAAVQVDPSKMPSDDHLNLFRPPGNCCQVIATLQ